MLLVAVLALLVSMMSLSVMAVGQVVVGKMELQNIADSAALSIGGGLSRNLNAVSEYNVALTAIAASIPAVFLVAAFFPPALAAAKYWAKESAKMLVAIPGWQATISGDSESTPYQVAAELMIRHNERGGPAIAIIPIPVNVNAAGGVFLEPMGSGGARGFLNNLLSRAGKSGQGRMEFSEDGRLLKYYPAGEKLKAEEGDKGADLVREYEVTFSITYETTNIVEGPDGEPSKETVTDTATVTRTRKNSGYWEAKPEERDLPVIPGARETFWPFVNDAASVSDWAAAQAEDIERGESDLWSPAGGQRFVSVSQTVEAASWATYGTAGGDIKYPEFEDLTASGSGAAVALSDTLLGALPLVRPEGEDELWLVLAYRRRQATVLSRFFRGVGAGRGDIPEMVAASVVRVTTAETTAELPDAEEKGESRSVEAPEQEGGIKFFFKAAPRLAPLADAGGALAGLDSASIAGQAQRVFESMPGMRLELDGEEFFVGWAGGNLDESDYRAIERNVRTLRYWSR